MRGIGTAPSYLEILHKTGWRTGRYVAAIYLHLLPSFFCAHKKWAESKRFWLPIQVPEGRYGRICSKVVVNGELRRQVGRV